MCISMETIRAFLAQDIVDGDPAAVSALNSKHWPTAADVAPYAYQSLGTLWLGALGQTTTTSANLAKTIVYKLGESVASAGEITLIAMPETSLQNPEGLKSNATGAMDFYMDIAYSLPIAKTDYTKIKQVCLRVRWLLDMYWRAKRTASKTSPLISLETNIDPSLADGLMRLRYLGNVSAQNGAQLVERWLVSQEIVTPY